MNKKQLIELLEPFPDDLQIWIDDAGYIEGGKRLESVEKILAYNANLDGDDIGDEWIYVEEGMSEEDKILLKTQKDKYTLVDKAKFTGEDVYSKEILLIKGL
jgi:hypothetical protein